MRMIVNLIWIRAVNGGGHFVSITIDKQRFDQRSSDPESQWESNPATGGHNFHWKMERPRKVGDAGEGLPVPKAEIAGAFPLFRHSCFVRFTFDDFH